MELTVLGVNILLLMAVWKFMLRKTILDHSRDKLFDLRADVRTTFIRNGWDLNSSAYMKLRDLINGHLRFTEEMGLSRTIYFTARVRENKELQAFMHERIQRVFATNDAAQRAYIEKIRRNALTVSLEYSIYSSGYFLILAMVMAPFFACGMVASLVNRQVEFTTTKFLQYIRHFSSYASVVMSKSAGLLANKFLLPDAVEAYSYRRGSAAA